MPYRLGRDCTLSVGGVEVIRAVDVNPSLTIPEIVTTTRQEGLWESIDVGHNKWAVSFTMKYYIGDTAIATIRTAALAQTEVAVAFTGGGLGDVAGVGKITRFDPAEPLEDIVEVSIDVAGSGALA